MKPEKLKLFMVVYRGDTEDEILCFRHLSDISEYNTTEFAQELSDSTISYMCLYCEECWAINNGIKKRA